ncbi:hypothetical protein TrST_g7698 [Triparma strigata]|uniref:ETFB lysine methyltransferase n=1 Tax=Triparma strigata TaxID=1606541 RepID=A0A9W7A137_9STRA|nr:hypothetical protein TrST_g7698 [Triparma strigata]
MTVSKYLLLVVALLQLQKTEPLPTSFALRQPRALFGRTWMIAAHSSITFSTKTEPPATALSGDELASWILLEFPDAVVTVTESPDSPDLPPSSPFFTDDGSSINARKNIWPVSSISCRVLSSEVQELRQSVDSYVAMMTQNKCSLVDEMVATEVSVEEENKDWMKVVQQDWKPRMIGVKPPSSALVVTLPFHTSEDVKGILPDTLTLSDVIEVKLTGGGAFGTGEHVTTRMCSIKCLEIVETLLESTAKTEPITVLDYGAGSGLISLACLTAEGARGRVATYGVEVDRTAVYAGRANAELNGLSSSDFEMFRPPEGAPGAELWDDYTGSESQDPGLVEGDVDRLADELSGSFNLIVANILAGSLVELHDTLERYCAAGGDLVLSGVLETQAEEVVEVYERGGFVGMKVEKVDDGWAMITGKRRAT